MNARASEIDADDVEGASVETEPTLRETIEDARDTYLESVETKSPNSETPSTEGQRARDPAGRFVPRTQSDPPNPEGAPRTQTPPAQVSPPPAQTAPQDPTLIAPNSWSAQAKAEWAALSPTIRAEIARRETEVHRTLTRQDEERQLGNGFSQVINQNREYFQSTGVQPQRLFQDFVNIAKTLAGQDINAKANVILQAARANGINLHALARMAGGAPSSPAPQGAQTSPAGPIPFNLLPPEMQQLYRDNQERARREQEQAQQQEQRAQQQTVDEIVAFRAKPEARFFDAVRDQMVALLQANAATSLQEAYDQAIWSRPDIRAILQREADEARAANEAKRQATLEARRKGGSVRGGAGVQADTAPQNRTLREELKANFAEAQRARV